MFNCTSRQPLRRLRRSAWLPVVVIGWCAFTANAAADVRITPAQKWSTVFGGSRVTLSFSVIGDEPIDGVFRWSFSTGGRTIEAGERAVRVEPPDVAKVKVSLKIPPVRDGVVLSTQLSVSVDSGGPQPLASRVQPITIFSKTPFFERSEWLQELDISLFDPQKETARVFSEAGIPFERIRNVAALDDLTQGLLIVGEGVSFERHRSLPETLSVLAARGVPVLCLAPRDGRFVLPDEGDDSPRSIRMDFRRNHVITQLDKRLDSRQWLSTQNIAQTRIQLRSLRNRVVGEFTGSPSGWPWLEFRFPGDSALIYCGFDVIKRWDDGPTPRFLIARLFERLNDQPDRSGQSTQTGRKP